jgi:hypothetical protein
MPCPYEEKKHGRGEPQGGGATENACRRHQLPDRLDGLREQSPPQRVSRAASEPTIASRDWKGKLLDNETKNRADVLLKLAEIKVKNFDTRRSYEWKLCLGIWTALAAFIGLVLKDGACAGKADRACVLILPAILLLMTHIIFLRGVFRANDLEKKLARFYEAQVSDLAGVDPFDKGNVAMLEALAKVQAGKGGLWAPVTQVLITVILLVSAALVLWFRN